jgi:hypothetical protein
MTIMRVFAVIALCTACQSMLYSGKLSRTYTGSSGAR